MDLSQQKIKGNLLLHLIIHRRGWMSKQTTQIVSVEYEKNGTEPQFLYFIDIYIYINLHLTKEFLLRLKMYF